MAVWAFVETFLFAGLLYGWAPVVWVLKQEHIYADLCPQLTPQSNVTSVVNISLGGNEEVVSYNFDGGNITTNVTGGQEGSTRRNDRCKPQDENFALCFTIGSALFCASSALFGHINYKFGTRITRICSMYVNTVICCM